MLSRLRPQVLHHHWAFVSRVTRSSPTLFTTAVTSKSTQASAQSNNVTAQRQKERNQEKEEKYTLEYRKKMANSYSLVIGSLVGIIGSSIILFKKMKSMEAKQLEDKEVETVTGNNVVKTDEGGTDAMADTLHKSQAGFRERKIIEYENRIRAYSTPDKIFRYFATLQDAKTSDIYMSPEDFVRSLTPDTMQPEGLGLDSFKKFDLKNIEPFTSEHFGTNSVFHALGDGGLISFSDYIFLLTVLGTSARHIGIAFKMFDLNGDGEVTIEEFKKVRSLFLSMTTTGTRHRDRITTGNVLNNDGKTGLTKYFFGNDGKDMLTVEEFVEFKLKLQEEVMFLEFSSFNPKDGRITECQFAEILLTYANISTSAHAKIIKRIRKTYGDKNVGIHFQDYLDFFNFLLNIRDVEMALSFHTVAGQAINKETFKQVAKTVTGVTLTDYLVEIVFCIFDENEDDHLSNREFIAIMKDRMFRGLNKPKDTGFTRFLSAIVTCAKSNIVESWTQPTHKH